MGASRAQCTETRTYVHVVPFFCCTHPCIVLCSFPALPCPALPCPALPFPSLPFPSLPSPSSLMPFYRFPCLPRSPFPSLRPRLDRSQFFATYSRSTFSLSLFLSGVIYHRRLVSANRRKDRGNSHALPQILHRPLSRYRRYRIVCLLFK